MTRASKDVFVCHASEDKPAVVAPLVEALRAAGISVWQDSDEIEWGESIIEQVNEGMRSARYVIVVMSRHMTSKNWPRREFHAALEREASSGAAGVLPLLVGSEAEVAEIEGLFPLMGDKRHLRWQGDPAVVVRELQPLLARDLPASAAGALRACFISSEFPPHVFGGLGIHVVSLTTALAAFADVDVVLPASDEEYVPPVPRVRAMPLATVKATYDEPTSWLHFARHAGEKIRTMEPADVVHCHDWVTVLGGIRCRWAQRIPLVYHVHLPNRSRLCASIENLGLICADAVTVSSEAMREELRERLPIRRIEVIGNGVDTELFSPGDEGGRESDRVLFYGRLVEQKGLEHLFRAFGYVRERFPGVELAIVGDGPLLPSLENLARDLALADKVRFLGWRTGPALVELIRSAKVVVVPSIYEPFGMTAIEAMACGKPVVASRTGGLKDLVRHGTTGFLAEPRDHLDLAQWIMSLLADDDARRQMGEQARRRAAGADYDWSQIARRFAELYRELAASELDLSVPEGAAAFRSQIARVAVEMDPTIGKKADVLMGELFDWMEES